MDLLCVKSVDGRGAEIDFSAMPGVSFSMQREPTFTSWTKTEFPVPALGSVTMKSPGNASEGLAGTPSFVRLRLPCKCCWNVENVLCAGGLWGLSLF